MARFLEADLLHESESCDTTAMPTSNQSRPRAYEFAVRIADPVRDEEALFALFRDARAPEFASLEWDDHRLDALLRTQFSAQRADYSRRFPGAEQRLALLEGEPVALLWVWHTDDHIRLLDIVVAASHRDAGIGVALMRRLQADAAGESLPLRHMVAVTNAGAIRFYERLGFVVVGDAGTHLLMDYVPRLTGETDLYRPSGG